MGASEGRKAVDPGVLGLAAAVAGVAPSELLMVHCGELPGIGPGATRLVLDVREHTESMHRCVPARIDRDPLQDRAFMAAVCWPRAHLGMDFSRATLAYSALHLGPGGMLWCAARKQKGGKRLAGAMEQLLGNVRVHARDAGYHIYVSQRGAELDRVQARAWLDASYEVRDPRLGHLVLRSAPGVFSRRQLDSGTRTLLDHAAQHTIAASIERVVDLGTGIGPLALWAAARSPRGRVLAIDSNYLAAGLASENAQRAGLTAQVDVTIADGLDGVSPAIAARFRGATDLFLINPPTHEAPGALATFLRPVAQWLAPNGLALAVVNRPGRATAALEAAGLRVDCIDYSTYCVLEARTRPHRSGLPPR